MSAYDDYEETDEEFEENRRIAEGYRSGKYGKKDFILGIKMENFPNEDFMDFHTRQKLVPQNTYFSSEYSFDKGMVETFKHLTQALISGVLNVPGVIKVRIKPYSIGVERAGAYTWEEIIQNLIPVFVSYLTTQE